MNIIICNDKPTDIVINAVLDRLEKPDAQKGYIFDGFPRNIEQAKAMEEKGINEGLDWYLDLRRYGGAEHGGFGLGFERLIMLITGINNIKDAIPFPRYFKHCIY